MPLRLLPDSRNVAPSPLKPDDFPFEVRQLLYGRKPHMYRILFTIDGETVKILHIRHVRRERLSER
jgi:hypothetical protein